MEITVAKEQGRVPVTVVSIRGEINAETADQLLAVVRQARAEGASDLLLDLSEVPYISSWGIRALSDIYSMLSPSDDRESPHHRLTTKSAHLKLLNATPQVQRVLSAAGLDLYLEGYADRKHAVASFGGAVP